MSNLQKALAKISVEDIIEFRDHGDMSNAPPDVFIYVQQMDKVRGMHLRIDHYGSRDAIINHLVKFDGYSTYLAGKVYDETMEYFYGDRELSKQAWRNIIAEQMQKGINTAFVLAKDANEVLKAVKELGNMAKVLGLDQPDAQEFPPELLDKPIKLYTSSAEDLGMPKIDRYALGRQIDELPGVSDAAKEMCKRDAQLLPVKFFRDARPSE